MVLCVAVDDNDGMTFHNRRQSQDKLLRRHILALSQGRKLWMNAYTAKQFTFPLPDNIVVDEDFWTKGNRDDFCFVENLSVAQYESYITKIFLFKWNRVYPADTYLDFPLDQNGWRMISVLEFEGNSHKKITREEWGIEKESM